MHKKPAALTRGLSLLGSSAVAGSAPTPAAAASDVQDTCWKGTPLPEDLNADPDPRKCKGTYETSKAGQYIAVINDRTDKSWNDLVKNVPKGSTAAQKWCSANSFTCGAITSVGTMLLGDVIRRSITGR